DMAAAADQLLAVSVDPGFVAEAPLAPGSLEGVWLARDLLNILKRSGPTRALAVRRWAQGLDAADWEALLRTAPELVGPVGGMPLERRYQANRWLIQRALEATSAEVARLAAGIDSDRANALRQREQTLRGFLADPTRQFLLFDNTGDGRVAEVLGDLANANNVAFVIPGITNTLDNFDKHAAADSRALRDEISRRAPPSRTAVIAWLGYDTPGVPDAILKVKAEVGGKALHDFVDGLLLEEPVVTTVVGHSYGSLVAGKALQGGLEVDTVAVIGSPGMGVDAVEELGLAEGTSFFAAGAPMDVVAWSQWHGADPRDPRFGGIPFETGGAGNGAYPLGHSRYYEQGSESLRNLALIVTDQRHIVTVERPTVLDRGLIGVDRLQAGAGQLGQVGQVGQALVDKAQERIDTVGDVASDIAELGGRIVRRQQ
ncbi:MAG: alpha/beta hydrolase, partial [Pseudonocardiaceae bacterium]